MEANQNLITKELVVDARVTSHLKEAAGWAKFLGIMGIIFSILVACMAFIIPYIMKRAMVYSPYNNNESGDRVLGMMSGAIVVAYIFAALLCFFLSLFCLRFGSKTRRAFAMTDQFNLDKGLMNLKFLFRFWGIMMVIELLLVVLGLLFGGFAAFMNR